MASSSSLSEEIPKRLWQYVLIAWTLQRLHELITDIFSIW